MYMLTLHRSDKPNKKFYLKTDTKKIYFGASKNRDYTLLNNPSSKYHLKDKRERNKVKRNYRFRHRNDPYNTALTPASLSYYILWNKPTLSASIKDYERRFNVNIVNRI